MTNSRRRKRHAAMAGALVATITAMGFGALPAVAATGTTYYVDSVDGDDSADGTSTSSAWRSLDQVNEADLEPGDEILLRRGATWTGEQLSPSSSGEEGSPILVGAYGDGAKPKIETNGAHADAVRLWNLDYWEIRDLDVSNATFVTDPEIYNAAGRAGDYRGVYIGGDDGKAHHHFVIDSVDVHDVTGAVKWIGERGGYTPPNGISFGNGWDRSKNTGGIVVLGSIADFANPGPTATTFNGVVIENSTIRNTSFGAVTIKQYTGDAPGAVPTGWGDRASENDANFSPHTDIVIRDNYISQAGTAYGANGIYVTGARDVVVERNLVEEVGTCGIETYNADDVTIQYNEVNYTSVKAGGQDQTAIDTDIASTNQLVQYNYVYGNGEGFLIYQKRFGDAVYRYNVVAASTKSQIHIASESAAHGEIYNNTVIDRGAYNNVISGGSQSGKYLVRNNIIFSTTGNAASTGNSNLTFTRNLYSGVAPRPQETDAVIVDPGFTNVDLVPPVSGVVRAADLSQANGLLPLASSRALNAGTSIPGNGGRDFAGVTLYQGTPDFGAFEYSTPAGQQTESVVGIVTSTANGLPIDQAVVSAPGVEGTALTGPDGWFALSGVPFGTTSVTVQREGFATKTVSDIVVAAGTPTRIDPTLVSTATTGTVTGKVIDATASPIPGARVVVTTTAGVEVGSGTTDQDGAFVLEVPVGTGYRLTASADEYLSAVRSGIVVNAGLSTAAGNIILSDKDVTYEAIFDFEELVAGSTGLAPLVAAQVNGTVTVGAETGNQFARLNRTSGTGSTAPATSLLYTAAQPLTGVVTVDQKVRRPGGQPSNQFFGGPYIRNAAGQNVVSVGLSANRVSAYNGGTFLSQVGTYTNNEWMSVRVVIDTYAQTYSLFLDGEAVLQEAALRAPIGAGVSVVANYADGPNRGTLDVDDLRIAHGVGYSPSEASLASLEASAGTLTQTSGTAYRLELAPGTETVKVKPSALSPFADATQVNGVEVDPEGDGVEVDIDGSPIEVVVTAEDGSSVAYTIAVVVPSVLVDDAGEVVGGNQVEIDVLANDSASPVIDPVSLTLLDGTGQPSATVDVERGRFAIVGGRVAFTADADADSGEATVAYRVTNSTGAASQGTVRVAVTAAPAEPQAPAWSASTVYLTGDEVTFGGKLYRAQWWTQNQQPGLTATGPWAEVGATIACAAGDGRAWTNSWVYTGGEVVVHGGQRFKAKWWTRGQAPGDQYGPWQPVGAC
ncbi:carboxypeptidase regulatory-like domain-containing protein [Agromyces sp. LHK192]|uniref:carboxypeptidase regulatory-like domain-containing protein n=1 Tax=Agromyces sp. LHK192 TaxID=2498704 RepID=UPI0013E3BC86|nr:carboxypeptidase regulatory-like domain-containing protein [Agromyces sp. LHK192]